jgi:hypothetical protein
MMAAIALAVGLAVVPCPPSLAKLISKDEALEAVGLSE